MSNGETGHIGFALKLTRDDWPYLSPKGRALCRRSMQHLDDGRIAESQLEIMLMLRCSSGTWSVHLIFMESAASLFTTDRGR